MIKRQLASVSLDVRDDPDRKKRLEEWKSLTRNIDELYSLQEKDYPAFFQKHIPTNWKVAYPRVYMGVEDYYSPKMMATWLMTSTILAAEGHVEQMARGSQYSATVQEAVVTVFMLAQNYDLPQFFLGRDLLAAVMQTDVPRDLKWWEVNLPYPGGFLYPPKGTLKTPDGIDVAYIGWGRLQPEQFAIEGQKRNAFQLVAKVNDESMTTFSKIIDDERDSDVFNLRHESIPSSEDPYAIDMFEEEHEFMSRMVRLVFSILMIPSARRELVETGRRIKTVCKKLEKKEFWTPNFIGRYYIPRIENVGRSSGTHGSPRVHWRRGHYRNQKFGKELRESKTIWIEPTLVMGDE
jgi:hypothetical protein